MLHFEPTEQHTVMLHVPVQYCYCVCVRGYTSVLISEESGVCVCGYTSVLISEESWWRRCTGMASNAWCTTFELCGSRIRDCNNL